jgi:hypothetical protein
MAWGSDNVDRRFIQEPPSAFHEDRDGLNHTLSNNKASPQPFGRGLSADTKFFHLPSSTYHETREHDAAFRFLPV